MAEAKYEICIFFESVDSGIRWNVARRDSKRVIETGVCETYDEAVTVSERAFYGSKLPGRR